MFNGSFFNVAGDGNMFVVVVGGGRVLRFIDAGGNAGSGIELAGGYTAT